MTQWVGWLLMPAGLCVGILAAVFWRRKMAAWYTLRIIAVLLFVVGLVVAFSLKDGGRGGTP